MATVRLATFNVENLFARFKFDKNIDPAQAIKDGWTAEQTSFDLASDDSKRITGQAIRATKADIVCLQEVENLEALKRFRNMHAGGSKLFPWALSIEGNDPRFIDVGVLSKHPIVHARSYAHLREGRSSLFSRDCLEIDVLVGSKTLTLFVQHYKSMMGGRKRTRPRRVLQVNKTIEIIKDRFGAKPGNKPWVVLGDFNDYMQTDQEGTPAIDTIVNWDQVENVVARMPAAEQWSHFYKDRNKYSQLDYLLPSKSLAKASDAVPEILRNGLPLRATAYAGPRFEGVGQDSPKASDHCPVIWELQI
jgi:endonuclease/exonuclease/phosphatase family metal-dependent hydrolase